jgi:hypothetical protein
LAKVEWAAPELGQSRVGRGNVALSSELIGWQSI